MKQLKQSVGNRGGGSLERKPWVTPAVQKIRAGDAEVGTRAAPDGAFTTS